MPRIRKKRDKGCTPHTNPEDTPTPPTPTSWCPRCIEEGITVQLGPRLYKKEELIDDELPHDSYDWLECRDCGHMVEGLF